MILSAERIRERNNYSWKMIYPFRERTIFDGMTYGLGFAGYDVRVEFDSAGEIPSMTIPSGGFLLASTIERFEMPNDVMGFVKDKSSWARLGIAVQNTVIEPGWAGYLTLELSNHSGGDIFIRRGSPIAQIIFMRIEHKAGDEIPQYRGKYQDQQRGPVESKREKKT